MTIATNDRRKEYPGNGVTLAFTGPRAFNASHVTVYVVVNATQVATLLTSGYTLTGVGGASTLVTLDAPTAATVTAGKTLLILRTVPYEQAADISNQGAYLPETLENAGLDPLAQQVQQVADTAERGLRVASTVVGVSTELTAVTPLAPVVVNATGTGFEMGSTLGTGDMLLRGNLAATDGGNLVAFKQSGTGAVPRTVQAKQRERISVKDFGAIGDGLLHPLSERFATLAAAQAEYPHAVALTDQIDWAAIQSAIKYVESITVNVNYSAGAELFVDSGAYLINETLTIRKAISVTGAGLGDFPTTNAPGTGGAMTLLFAVTGMADKPMVRAIAATTAQVLIEGSFEGVQLNGAGLASYGFHGSSLSRWKLDVSEFRCRLAGMRLDDANATLNSFNEIRNNYVSGVDVSTAGSHGLWIIGTQGTSAGNPQQRIFMASAYTVNGDCLRFESDVDNAIVYYTTGIVTGTGRNLALIAGASTPRVNFFLYFAGGAVQLDAATYGNVFYATSSETTSFSGAGQYHLQGVIDYGTGGMWQTNRFLLTDELIFRPSDFQVSAAAAGATVLNLASFLPCWTLDPVTSEMVVTSQRAPTTWRNGSLTHARVNISFEAAPGAATSVVLRVQVQASASPAGLMVGAPSVTTYTFALPSNDIRRNFDVLIPLAAPLVVPAGGMIVFGVQRMAADAADTATTDLYLTGASLLMQSLGPQSAGSGVITLPSMGT